MTRPDRHRQVRSRMKVQSWCAGHESQRGPAACADLIGMASNIPITIDDTSRTMVMPKPLISCGRYCGIQFQAPSSSSCWPLLALCEMPLQVAKQLIGQKGDEQNRRRQRVKKQQVQGIALFHETGGLLGGERRFGESRHRNQPALSWSHRAEDLQAGNGKRQHGRKHETKKAQEGRHAVGLGGFNLTDWNCRYGRPVNTSV